MANVPGKFKIPLPVDLSGPRTCCVSTHSFPGSIHEIDSSITRYQQLLFTSSRSDPHRTLNVYRMALYQFQRYIQSNKREDLDKAITHYTESILLPWPRRRPFILSALFSLANALILRTFVSKQPEDAICAATYLFHLRDQPHEIPSTPRHKVTAWLVEALALKVKLESGNVMQNIREIAVFSRELLERSDVDATHLIPLIDEHVWPRNLTDPDGWDQPLDEIIECLRAVRKHRPDILERRFIFAVSLAYRYIKTCVDDDYKEAVPILDEIITYGSPGNSQDEFVAKARESAMFLLTALADVRSVAYETPEHLEEALYRAHTYFSSSSFKKDPDDTLQFLDPEVTARKRFRYFGYIEGVESSGDSPLSQLVMSETSPTDKLRDLHDEIGRSSDDTTKIHEAIEKGRSILTSKPASGPHEGWGTLDLFSDILYEAFGRTKKIEYLNESISIRRQVIESPFLQQFGNVMTLPNLSVSLFTRSREFPGYRTQDVDEGLETLSRYVKNDVGASLPKRFKFACLWARTARSIRHPTTSTAYETTLSLMQDTSLFSPTLQLQYTTLANLARDKTDDIAYSLPLDYASYQIDHHQLEKAIETLERGRSLLWSEMRRLRVSVDQLLKAHPDLGRSFAAVNRDLEELTKSAPPSHKLTMVGDTADGIRAVDPFGRLLLKQRGLLRKRAELISQVRALPGFESFLTSPSWDTLRSAAFYGPVIIINHSEWRSDILVLLHHLPPSLIRTPNDFFERANALKDKLLVSRRNTDSIRVIMKKL